ncbi:MAG: sulfatase [Saprospiraceae bacterium]|nr:sulfatase [Saprospiraceae bacterium]
MNFQLHFRPPAFLILMTISVLAGFRCTDSATDQYNVLFIIADDLTYTALSCYGNQVCHTPNIDRLAARGMRFTNAYCQGTYCGPSRASFLSGYYPHATGVLGYKSPRPQIAHRQTWPQLFKDNGYHTSRISKIFHMGVPGGIEEGGHGADDSLSWTVRYNSPGPEWKADGDGETLEGNPEGTRPVVGGNTFVVVEADGNDLIHSDGKTAAKAVELLKKKSGDPFWMGVGFVRPHVPFVAPRSYYPPFKPYDQLDLPEKVPNDWDDIPTSGINYKTSENMQMDLRKQRKALGGYYASVAFMDAQVGKVLDALEEAQLDQSTIVIFTSDHGYHLGEHDFWAKVSLLDESSRVPLIISHPEKEPGVCSELVELLDLYPTISALCGLDAPLHVQGKNIAKMLDDPTTEVHQEIFCVAPMRKGFLIRDKRYAYIQYGEDAENGIELYDTEVDPRQYTNLAIQDSHQKTVAAYQSILKSKLSTVRSNDL